MNPRTPRENPAPFESALALARDGRHAEALAALEHALEGGKGRHGTGAVDVLCRVSRLAEAAADLHHAERFLVLAVRLAPGFADLHYRLGRLRLAAHRRAEARTDFETALRLNPGYVAARLERSLLDAREGRLGEALETLRAIGRDERVPEPRMFGQGLRSLEHADWEEAGELLRRALAGEGPGTEAAIQEYHARRAAGDPAGSAEVVRAALRQHEGYADLHALLAAAEMEQGHWDDALASLARALEIHPDFHAARIQLAVVLEALGDRVQAEEQVALVRAADPGNAEAVELEARWSRLQRRRRKAAA